MLIIGAIVVVVFAILFLSEEVIQPDLDSLLNRLAVQFEAIMDMVQGSTYVHKDKTEVSIKQGQEFSMEEHSRDHFNVENINISLATNSNQLVPQSLSHVFTRTKDTSMEGNWTKMKELLWLFLDFMMELLRCQVVHQDAHFPLQRDFIQVAKVELARLEIITSIGEFNLVLKDLYQYVDEVKRIVEDCLTHKYWLSKEISFLERVHEFHLYMTGFTKSLLRALSRVNHNDQPLMEIEGEITVDHKYFNIGVTKFVEEMSHLEQNAHGCRVELIKQLVGYVQEQELHEGDPIHVQNLVANFFGPYVYYDMHTDKIFQCGARKCGHVYKTMWIGLECAQKVLNDVDNKSTFTKKVSGWVGLCHQNIVEKKNSVLMELMFTNLQKFMECRNSSKQNVHPFSLHVAFDIILQIAKGMSYLHGKNIVHHNLRPQNIWVTPVSAPHLAAEGYVRVKLADFSLCELTFPHHLPCTNTGAIDDMALELMEENVKFGGVFGEAPNPLGKCFIKNLYHPMKKDVYAFGIVCAEILSSRQGLQRNICGEGKRSSSPNYDLFALIDKCCANNPSDRPNFASIVKELEDHKPLTPLPRFFSYGPSHSQVNKRSQIAKKAPSLEISQNSTDNLTIVNSTLPNFGRKLSKSFKRSHDYLMEEDEYHEFEGEEKMNFVDKNRMPHPSSKLTKFPRNNYSGIEMCKFTRPLYGIKHLINSTKFQGSEENILPRKLSSSQSQSQEKHIGCSKMEVNVNRDFERENKDAIWLSSHKVDITMVENATDANHQDTSRLHDSALEVGIEDHNSLHSTKLVDAPEVGIEDHNSLHSTKLVDAPEVGIEDHNSLHSTKLVDAPEVGIEDYNSLHSTKLVDALEVGIEDHNSLHSTKLVDAPEVGIEDHNSLYSTKLVDHHNEEEIARSGTKTMNLSTKSYVFICLPRDIHEASLNKLDYEDLCRMKQSSKDIKALIDSDAYHASRGEACPSEASMSSLYFFIKDKSWHCSGFDCILRKWRRLPPLTCLPPPDEDLFKEYLVAGSYGLFCINVSKVPHEERLLVCNPMTQKIIELPPLNLRRNPVLMHMLVNHATNSYKVIVAGSSGMEGGDLSKRTEVFDSLTWAWKTTGDIPGPKFCLNEYQTGVCINDILYCIAFLDDGSGQAISGKGVLAYNINEGKWMTNWKCPLPSPTPHHTNSIAQLLECNGELYLFLEREHGRHVDHCIEKLENQFSSATNMVGNWKNVVRESKAGGRGLLVYPEFTCVPHGDGKICIFNTIEHKGVVYDIVNGGNMEEIQPPPTHLGEGFHSLNPLSFTFHPNFKNKVDGNVNKCKEFSLIEAPIEGFGNLGESSNTLDQNVGDDMVTLDVQQSLLGRPSIDDPSNKSECKSRGDNWHNVSSIVGQTHE